MLRRSYIKKKPKSERSVLIRECDKLFRELLLIRDKACQYSGKTDNLQVSHYISRENKHLRWDETNCVILNAGVHIFLFHKRPHLYREWMVRRIGEDKVIWLEMQDKINTQPLYTCELKLIKRCLQEKLKGGKL